MTSFVSDGLKYSSWMRCKVFQRGTIVILERLNRTYKDQFAFRQDGQSMANVHTATLAVHRWYNHERRHTAPLSATSWLKRM